MTMFDRFKRWLLVQLAHGVGLRDVTFTRGAFNYVHRADSGKLKRKGRGKNASTTVGRNLMNDVMFHATAASGTWYAGLISGTSYSALAAGDTMSSHAGWTELTSYSEAVRQTWVEGASASGLTTNSAAMTFTANGNGTAKGAFLVDNSTKSGTSGTLWATGLFDADLSLVNLDTLDLTYEQELQATA